MPAAKLKQFLDARNVRYLVIQHSPAFTAQEIASSAHIRGRELAKTVMVMLDGTMAMAVLTATRKLDMELLEKSTGTHRARLASEKEFKDMFPDCEVGAMPPFGNLYGMQVFVDEMLADDSVIAFNAGSHAELIQMTYPDFARLVEPKVAPLAFEIKQHI
jgi:Ala-tRNA(Pro) deacylase